MGSGAGGAGGAGGSAAVFEPEVAKPFEGEVGVDGADFGEAVGHELGVAAGGDDGEFAGGEGAFEFRDQFADEAAVAVDGADEHGFLGTLSDRRLDFPDFDAGEEGGFFVQVIGHGGEAGGDDAAGVTAAGVDDVEGDGGAEVDDDDGGAVGVSGGDGIGEAIGADGGGFGVIEADAAEGAVGEEEGAEPVVISEQVAGGAGGAGDDAAGDGAAAGGTAEHAADGFDGGARDEVAGGHVDVGEQVFGGGEADVAMSVADVEQEQAGMGVDLALGVRGSFHGGTASIISPGRRHRR